jgi:hypothetical protein
MKNLIGSVGRIEFDLTSKYETKLADLENTLIILRRETERVSFEIERLRNEILTNSIKIM